MTEVIDKWFDCWKSGNIGELPVTESFEHRSPFGKISGKEEYLKVVNNNLDKFLGQDFIIHDRIEFGDRACVRYTAIQDDFSLDVSEWYYFKMGLIDRIIAYYHIGDIRSDRKLDM